jgi:zinc transport system substrate-binding protein
MKNLLKILFLCLIIISPIIFSGCSGASGEEEPEEESKINIVTSIFPISEIAEKVGSEKVAVTNITPIGVGPHDYEPTPKEVILLNKADLVILNGAGMESWSEDIVSNLKEKNIPVLILADHVSTLIEHEEGNSEENNHHHHGKYDPHFLIDPVIYMEEIDSVTNTIIGIDPENSDYYKENSKAYSEKILELHQTLSSELSNCRIRTIVTNHEAFNYFAKRYGLELIAIAGISPDVEPSSKKLAELANLIEEKDVKYIFTETLVSPKFAQTLAEETGAKTLILNPMGGLTKDEVEEGKDYIIVSRENLSNLKTALECSK